MGQPLGGVQTYCSSLGRVVWQKAWIASHCFGTTFDWVERARSRRSSIADRTGAKQSDFDQLCGSRLPNTTMRYFARVGWPCESRLILEMAIVGRGRPRMDLRF